MKKSQMEMAGLAIIAVLLTFALLFVVRFVVYNEKGTGGDDFRNNKIATAMMNVMLDTTAAGCNDHKLGELLKDCWEGVYTAPQNWNEDDLRYSRIPNSGNIECSLTENSCPFVMRSMNELVNMTVDENLKKNYAFAIINENEECEIVTMPSNVIFHSGPGCTGTAKAVCQPWPTSKGDIFLRLDICNRVK